MKDVLILPTYNERENIARIIPEIFRIVPRIFILVVDDNSPDGTATIVEELKKKYPNVSLLRRQKKEGLGKAYVHAFGVVLKDPEIRNVISMDADFSHNPSYLTAMIEKSKKFDVIFGARYIEGGGTPNWEPWRRLVSKGGNLYSRVITGMPIHDATGGFNLMNVRLLRKIALSSMEASGYAFQIELKYLLLKAGASYYELPIVFESRRGGESKFSAKIFFEGLWCSWRMRFKKHIA